MKSIKYYDGLYRDLNFKPPIDYIFFVMIETRSREFGWVIDRRQPLYNNKTI
jgi:hypothetical protein